MCFYTLQAMRPAVLTRTMVVWSADPSIHARAYAHPLNRMRERKRRVWAKRVSPSLGPRPLFILREDNCAAANTFEAWATLNPYILESLYFSDSCITSRWTSLYFSDTRSHVYTYTCCRYLTSVCEYIGQ